MKQEKNLMFRLVNKIFQIFHYGFFFISNVPIPIDPFQVVVGASILDICMMCLEDDLKVSNSFVYFFLVFFTIHPLYPEARIFSSI